MKIVLEHLTKQFPPRGRKVQEPVTAVNDFNFEIPDGQLIGLLGPSGCGKSTTLNMICGLEKPTSGRILFGDDDVTSFPPERRGVGMVFQNYALYPHLTVKQNILFPLQNLKGKDKLSRFQMDERAQNAARLVQITELMDRRPSELSGGQQQRVAIARALVKMPRVLLLDEPLSNLDARLRLQTREEIRKIQRATKITTVFVTHDQEEAMSISDMIVVMKDGVVQQIGKPQDVYDSPVNLFVAKFLGTPPINVFEGQIRGGSLYIGENAVLLTPGISDQPVSVGIRPEGFIPDEKGSLCCQLGGMEVMGRDISVVSTHASSEEGYNSASQTYYGTGMYNYSYVLHDPYFLQAIRNTFILVVITVPLSTLLALLISVALSSVKALKKLFQTIYFLPYVTNTLAVGLVFMILFKKTAYSDGLINLVLKLFGQGPVDFIDGPYWAKMLVLCIYTIWIVMPFKVLILTSALASVNQNYYNAARVDGTSRFRIFVRITLTEMAAVTRPMPQQQRSYYLLLF